MQQVFYITQGLYMQQKKIIFSLLSLICGAAFSMENNNSKPIPDGYFKIATVYVSKIWLNDYVLGNITYDIKTDKLGLRPDKWKEKKERHSALPGFYETRDNATWTRGSDFKEFRTVYPTNTEKVLAELNDSFYQE